MLTPVQRQTYEYWKLDPTDDSINIVHTELLPSETDVVDFAAEMKRLARQLTILQTRVEERNGEPRLVYDHNIEVEVTVHEISDEEADARMKHQGILFDMNKGPMVCFNIFVTPTRKLINTAQSNMLLDGWSMNTMNIMLVKGALTHLESFSEEYNLFPEHLVHLEEQRRSPRFEHDKSWWLDYMKGIDHLTDFAIKEDYECGKMVFRTCFFDKGSVLEACHRKSIAPAEVLLAAWTLALADMTQQKTITFITSNRGRTRRQMNVLGNYLVEKALRIDVEPGDTPMEVVTKVQHANFMTNLHHLFTEQDLEPYIGASDCGTCVIFNEDMDHTEWTVEGKRPKRVFEIPTETCEFLCGIMWGRNNRYELELTYSEPLYREEEVDRFLERFVSWFHEFLK